MRKERLAILLLTLFLAVGGSRGAQAAELVMFDDPGCSWCQRWLAEVGPTYPQTAQGRMAPLRRVQIRDQATAGVSLEQPVTGTPTFVLADGGREVGRIIGYPGPALLLRRARPAPAAATRARRAPAPAPRPRSPVAR